MSSRLHPSGGALLFVLILCGTLASCAFLFTLMLHDLNKAAQTHLSTGMLQPALHSALEHATALLYDDLTRGPADTYDDFWAITPHGRPFPSRQAWLRYRVASTNLSTQPWFSLPGPQDNTVIRYRFSIVDVLTSGAAAPTVWSNHSWIPTDDLNAADITRLQELLRTFDPAATNPAWLARAVASLADTRDENHALLNPALPDTEAIRFDARVIGADQRWVHLDDTLRLGRYYEERANHNFFLIAHAEPFFNPALGRSNIAVTLDDQPMTYLAGWEHYHALRTRASLPRWYPGMWAGITAATGAGLPEPAGSFKYQPVISNTTDTLFFDDDKLSRYLPLGQWRQTVTFAGWFSSLNELTRGNIPDVRARGALVTTAPFAPDSLFITNFTPHASYAVSLITGTRLPHPLAAFVSFDPHSPLQTALFNSNGVASLFHGRPLQLDHASPGIAELLIRAPQHSLSTRTPFYLESILLQQPEFIALRNYADSPVNIYAWRLGYLLGTRLWWTAPFSSAIVYHAHTHGPVNDALPILPPQGRAVLTPSAALYDWCCGVTRNGIWGDHPQENSPVIELGWQGWGPSFHVENLRPLREHRMPGSSNREFVWETDWRMQGEPIAALRGIPGLLGLPVMLAPPPQAPDLPVYGAIVALDADALVVRCAGTRSRLARWPNALLHVLSLPRAANSFWLLLPDGLPAAASSLLTSPTPTNLVHNAPFTSTRQRAAALASRGISTASDWFLPTALFRPFDATACVVTSSLTWSPGAARIITANHAAWTFDPRFTKLPTGTPGLLYSSVHLSPTSSLPLLAISDGSLHLYLPRGTPVPPMRNRTVLLSPSPRTPGLHLFGEPGFIEFLWHNLPHPSAPLTLTLAGYASPPPAP
ncbi:MAG: hypothetical protein N2595_03250, partial [bacterium]|nr:hypothetical protein [bacterium]